MKVNKFLVLVLALAMVLALAACGGSGNNGGSSSNGSGGNAPSNAGDTGNTGSDAAGGDASAAADSDTEYVKEKGTLIIGITDFEPMDYKNDSGEWIGFDADMRPKVLTRSGTV